MSLPSATGFYAVAKGRNPGIYQTWEKCEEQTKGFPGAKFKKFGTNEDAMNYLKQLGFYDSRRGSHR